MYHVMDIWLSVSKPSLGACSMFYISDFNHVMFYYAFIWDVFFWNYFSVYLMKAKCVVWSKESKVTFGLCSCSRALYKLHTHIHYNLTISCIISPQHAFIFLVKSLSSVFASLIGSRFIQKEYNSTQHHQCHKTNSEQTQPTLLRDVRETWRNAIRAFPKAFSCMSMAFLTDF